MGSPELRFVVSVLFFDIVSEEAESKSSTSELEPEALAKAPKVFANAHIVSASRNTIGITFGLSGQSMGASHLHGAVLAQSVVYLEKKQAMALAETIVEVCSEDVDEG